MSPPPDGIFSLRIVTVDFYMEKPKSGLDPCFSEFRAKEIKKVPIIRIFGSNVDGQKTCMHVHGIFPYLYIPYGKKDFESLDKAVYLIASSIDKAINISLGQGSSGSQHVFKIQQVKGIPFYGYHQKEHQYLKIYMLNPRFIRRTANLLQNGAIMGKIFQPHESHVPYILQFFIDYNLYGMSFLHVPKEILKFRRKDEQDVVLYPTQKGQILDCSIAQKQSTSQLEVDIGSAFILNRFQLVTKTSAHANPGIEAIWQDERVRRQNLSKECDEVPPFEIPASQERPDVQPTESEQFFRIGLMNRLQQLDASMDQTMNSTLQSSIAAPESSIKERKRTFNLKKLIANAVYPEECTQEDILTNASFIADHLSNRSSFHTSLRSSKTPSVPEPEDVFLDDTIVDEDLVLSLTQPDTINQSLREQDIELLDVMKQLGEREDENGIDLDSSLAPLTQNLDVNSSQKPYDGTNKNVEALAIESRDDDSDNECLNDFTIAMDDMDELLLKLSQTNQNNENAPTVEQLDGADDKLRTPKKSKTPKPQPSTPQTPKSSKHAPRSPRSPRTPNSIAKKYAPLPLVIQSRSLRKNPTNAAKITEASPFLNCTKNNRISISSAESDWFESNRDQLSLRKQLALGEIRRKSVSTDSDWSGLVTKTSGRGRKASVDLDKTQITCNFRAARKKCERRLKVYCAESATESDPSTRYHTEEELYDCEETPPKNIARLSLQSVANGITKSPRVLIKKSPRMQEPQETPKKSDTIAIDLTANENNSPSLAKMSPRVLLKKFPQVDDSLCRTSPHLCNGNSSKFYIENKKVSPMETHRNGNLVPSPNERLSPRVVVKKCPKIKELQNQNSVEETEIESQERTHSVNSNEGIVSPRVIIKKSPLIKAIAHPSEEKCNSTPIKTKLSPSVAIRKSPYINKLMESVLGEVGKNIENLSEDRNPRSKRKSRLSLKSHKITKAKKESKSEAISASMAESLEAIYTNNDKRRKTPSARPTKKLRIELKRLKLAKTQSQESTPCADKKPYTVIVNNEYELIPVAGPSHRDRFIISSLKTPNKTKQSIDNLCTEDNDELNVHSFYEKSFHIDSPSVFSEISAPSPGQFLKCTQSSLSPTNDRVVIITPHQLPETYEEVEENCKNYDIPEMVHQPPFYSSHDDVTHRKEVGHTVLRIPGRSLNDVDDFESRISGLEGFSHSRKLMMQSLGGTSSLNDDRIREYLSTEKTVLIEPLKLPPTKQDAKVWLKARELLKEKGAPESNRNVADDSPIKIRRQKVVMLMENELGDSGGEDIDCSMRSLSLTPLTPLTKSRNQTPATLKSNSCTPLTPPRSGNRKVKGPKLLRAKVSLSQKLKDMCVSNAFEKCNGEDVPPPIACVPTEKLLKTMIACEDGISGSQGSSKSNETVSSEAVLAELEKSSFVRNLHSSQGSLDNSFGISIATLNNTFGFKVNLENLQQAKSDVEHNYLTTLSLEVFVATREDLHPNPEFDAILCIFYAIENSIPSTCAVDTPAKVFGFIIVSDETEKTCAKLNGLDADAEIKAVTSELHALAELLELCARWDPDIFVGYEIEMSSWGYVMERAKYLDLNIAPLLSRVPSQKVRDFVDEDRDQLTDLDTETKLCGRILLDVWRLMRSEIALTSYSFENVVYHILHRRCPLHSHKDLTQWFRAPQTRWIVLEYFVERVRGTLELLEQLDLIGRTSEMAKLIGIQFYEVLSRGSQFRVESMMLRIAKPKNLVPLSPSVQQRAHMRAPEYLPLILEPQSRFYPDPVIVLDFQSLYPSMIMAYNYCFSTCLGRVEHLGQSVPFEFGASQLRVSPTLLKKLLEHDLVTISPCGVVYVKREIREGILPRMLSEVLDTRQMVKQSMKLHKRSTALQRILHSRQLGLKLIANVTYGYTAANFSGRMPCVEVGDSVVAKGRETLERAIKLVDANKKWNVKVVYGDTDSLFVLVPGRCREEAFRIGTEIVELVTQDNPQPVKLKLEKVYQPCILQTKKRYVGYMYETADQQEPIFEAKGIETVRRDGCPVASKMLEKCLKILFESADVSQVKSYVCRQFTKLLSGKANIQDLIFAKEFRGLNGYKPTACVPALELTRKWIQTDPRKIPRRGERVPFIVTNGPPGVPLIKLVRSPRDVLADEGLKINAIYYITKAIIPPLNRCLLLIGADVNEWFTNLPRKILFTPALSAANEIIATNASKKSTISQYFSSTNCIIDCGRQTKLGVCSICALDAMKTVVTLEEKISKFERSYFLTLAICQACTGRPYLTNCASFDCPVLYVLEVKRRELNQITHMKSILAERYLS